MKNIQQERPGAILPWPSIQKLLSAQEIFEKEAGRFLAAPKELKTLSALLFEADQKGIVCSLDEKADLQISYRALNQITIDKRVVEIFSGALLTDLDRELQKACLELGFYPEKKEIRSAFLKSTRSFFYVRKKSIEERLMGCEFLDRKGERCILGSSLKSGFSISLFMDLLQDPDYHLVKLIFLAEKKSFMRLKEIYSFQDPIQLMETSTLLEQKLGSLERLELVLSKEKRHFLIVQIAGCEKEMELFNELSFLKQYRVENTNQIEHYLHQFTFKETKEWADLQKGEYGWFFKLANRGFKSQTLKKNIK